MQNVHNPVSMLAGQSFRNEGVKTVGVNKNPAHVLVTMVTNRDTPFVTTEPGMLRGGLTQYQTAGGIPEATESVDIPGRITACMYMCVINRYPVLFSTDPVTTGLAIDHIVFFFSCLFLFLRHG